MKKLFLITSLIIFLNLSFLGNFATAQSGSCGNVCPGGTICIPNPLKACSFQELIESIIKFLQLLAGVVTAIVIVVAGYYFVASMGDPAKVSQARKMVLYALIGLGIILMAQAIIALIEAVIKG